MKLSKRERKEAIATIFEKLSEGKYRTEADLFADIEKYIKFRICRCKKVVYHGK